MKKNKTILQLPFEGVWFVVWGGDTKKLNYHHDSQNQKYAFDVVIVDEKDKSCKGKGKENRDYYAFGKKILAPASGVVIEAVDGIKDNKLGSTNKNFNRGNFVIIRHLKNEISVLAHLKRGSVRVKAGDKIKTGQAIGLCGNSGNSSEPHLHYHLQDSKIIQDGKGIKCYFKNIEVKKKGEKKYKTEYSPIKGERVNNFGYPIADSRIIPP